MNETLYVNNNEQFGQVGISLTKKEWIEMFKYWDRDFCMQHNLEPGTDEHFEQQFNEAIKSGKIEEEI